MSRRNRKLAKRSALRHAISITDARTRLDMARAFVRWYRCVLVYWLLCYVQQYTRLDNMTCAANLVLLQIEMEAAA